MEFAVCRDGRTLVTLHEGTETTAIDAALADLQSTFEAIEKDSGVTWELGEGTVHEYPTAPFDPYTIAVEFRLRVSVEADSAEEAVARGEELIEDTLTEAGLRGVSYTTAPKATAP